MQVKVCKKHGELTPDNIKVFRRPTHMTRACLICIRERDRLRSNTDERKKANRARYHTPEGKEKRRQYDKKNREHINLKMRMYYHKKKNDPKYKEKMNALRRSYFYRYRDNLTDWYVKMLLGRGPEIEKLIPLKRIMIQLNREVKKIKTLEKDKHIGEDKNE